MLGADTWSNAADLMHSYLGLCFLTIMGEPGLKKLDSALCISIDAKERFLKRRMEKEVKKAD